MSHTPGVVPWPSSFGDKLAISEVFYSIQGEGRFAGRPSIFIRLAYCNLGCVWCDTRFTWDPAKFTPEMLRTPVEAVQLALSVLPKGAAAGEVDVVITGGEPMLQQERIPALIDEMAKEGFAFFEIETNGMYRPSQDMLSRISWFNGSPKLSNNSLAMDVNCVPDVLRILDATNRADFKFVVQSEDDITEIVTWYLPHIRREHVYLMPEGVTAQRQLSAMPWVLEACRKYRFRFSPRLHVMAWGNERGR